MIARTEFRGTQLSPWLRHAAVRHGVLTGIYLSCVFVAWLVVANRVRELERYAGLRNLAAGLLLVIVLAMPVLRFRHNPARLFVAGLTAWTLLTITYMASEIHFTLLGNRMGALHVFVLGAVSYGFVAVLDWVLHMCASARSTHLAQSREASHITGGPRIRSSS